MRKLVINFLAAFLFLASMASCVDRSDESLERLDVPALPIPVTPEGSRTIAQGEVLLSETENAYNPIPNSDGSLIAYVRTGWGRPGGSGGFGRSNLVSDIHVMDIDGNVQTKDALADAFLYGWSSDGKSLNSYRSWVSSTVSLEGEVLTTGRFQRVSDCLSLPERVSFSPLTNSTLWLHNYYENVKQTQTSPGSYYCSSDFVRSSIQSSEGEIAVYQSPLDLDALLVPSPNGRYIAVAPSRGGTGEHLLVFDNQSGSWADLGEMVVHPDEGWDYIRPSWNPWFADSSGLVFVTNGNIVISSPDGNSKQVIVKPKRAIGIPVPSPDGRRIAFVTFEPTPKNVRRDLKFWGGTTIWIVPSLSGSQPRAVTVNNRDTTYCLRWLNHNELVFDRIADETGFQKARLWKVGIQD